MINAICESVFSEQELSQNQSSYQTVNWYEL